MRLVFWMECRKFAVALVFSFASLAKAEVLWYADPAKAPSENFCFLDFEGVNETKGFGSVTAVEDPKYGQVWRVYKPKADKRAEIRGARGIHNPGGFGGLKIIDKPYYIGWRWKFESRESIAGNVCIFQWKGYRPFTQNYPFLMEYNGREVQMRKFDDHWMQTRKGVATIWKKPVKMGEWVNFVVIVKQSEDKQKGYIEFYVNGEMQKFSTGETRYYHKTLDGSETGPKWGAYNSSAVGREITVHLAEMRITTSLETAMHGSTIPVLRMPRAALIGTSGARLWHNFRETPRVLVPHDLTGTTAFRLDGRTSPMARRIMPLIPLREE